MTVSGGPFDLIGNAISTIFIALLAMMFAMAISAGSKRSPTSTTDATPQRTGVRRRGRDMMRAIHRWPVTECDRGAVKNFAQRHDRSFARPVNPMRNGRRFRPPKSGRPRNARIVKLQARGLCNETEYRTD
jgi:hypothetical protein